MTVFGISLMEKKINDLIAPPSICFSSSSRRFNCDGDGNRRHRHDLCGDLVVLDLHRDPVALPLFAFWVLLRLAISVMFDTGAIVFSDGSVMCRHRQRGRRRQPTWLDITRGGEDGGLVVVVLTAELFKLGSDFRNGKILDAKLAMFHGGERRDCVAVELSSPSSR
ncbi:hypothetical protein TIFTF001_026066, partial [Ficus carica]